MRIVIKNLLLICVTFIIFAKKIKCMENDIRWLQRLDNYHKACAKLFEVTDTRFIEKFMKNTLSCCGILMPN